MLDPRNDPHGYDAGEAPRRYRIRSVTTTGPYSPGRSQIRDTADPEYVLGDVVERLTVPTHDTTRGRWFHALQAEDQLFADLCTRKIQEACRFFYDRDWTPMPGIPDITLTDAQVAESIRTLDLGENSREAERVGKARYVLTDLPWGQQRALIEHLYALRREWGFEKVDAIDAEASTV